MGNCTAIIDACAYLNAAIMSAECRSVMIIYGEWSLRLRQLNQSRRP
jgi:hypothetical protein